jgi:hypothetical protein
MSYNPVASHINGFSTKKRLFRFFFFIGNTGCVISYGGDIALSHLNMDRQRIVFPSMTGRLVQSV